MSSRKYVGPKKKKKKISGALPPNPLRARHRRSDTTTRAKNITHTQHVQATYIEARKIGVGVSRESSSSKEDKRKGNGKKANSATMKEGKLSCKHCKKEGHNDEHCWQLHP
jgi:hypothetical protein